MRQLPVFVGAGLTRSGTTWVFRQLEKHPQICTTVKKETGYFHRSRGPGRFYRLLQGCPGGEIAGEFDPSYCRFPEAAENLKATFPHARTMFLLRNPVDRSFTMWKARKYKGGTDLPFLAFFRQNKPQFRFAPLVKRWGDTFPEVKLFFYDDLRAKPLPFIRSVFRFLGVDASFVPPGYQEWETKDYNIYYRKHPVSMTAAEEHEVQDFFGPMIDRLEKIAGRDLSSWRKMTGRV